MAVNKSQTYPDNYLSLNALRNKLFDAIEGEQTIGVIAREHEATDTARMLFEGLWRYDQVDFSGPSQKVTGHQPRSI